MKLIPRGGESDDLFHIRTKGSVLQISLNQVTIEPPFTKIICPDMYEASSEASST
jgi:hypothetical protein